MFVWAVVITGIAGMFFSWLVDHDKDVMAAGDAYTACVQSIYHMTPQAYLYLRGEYPQCKKINTN